MKKQIELWANIMEVIPPWADGPANEDKIKDKVLKALHLVFALTEGKGKMPPLVEYSPNVHLILGNAYRKPGVVKQIPTTCFAMSEDGRVWRIVAIGTEGAPKDV